MKSFSILSILLLFSSFSFSQQLRPVSYALGGEDSKYSLQEKSSIQDLFFFEDQLYILEQDRYCHLLELIEGKVSLLTRAENQSSLYTTFMELDNMPYLIRGFYELLNLKNLDLPAIPFSSPNLYKILEPTIVFNGADGSIYMGTSNDGLFIFRRDANGLYSVVSNQYSIANGHLPSNTIQAIFEDDRGTIWIGTDIGMASIYQDSVYNLSRPDPVSPLKTFLNPDAAVAEFAESITAFEQWEDRLYIGSSTGLYDVALNPERLEDLNNHPVSEKFSLPLGPVNDLLVDSNDNLWVASNYLIQFNIPADSLILYSAYPEYGNNIATVISENPKDASVWVGTERGGLFFIESLLFNKARGSYPKRP